MTKHWMSGAAFAVLEACGTGPSPALIADFNPGAQPVDAAVSSHPEAGPLPGESTRPNDPSETSSVAPPIEAEGGMTCDPALPAGFCFVAGSSHPVGKIFAWVAPTTNNLFTAILDPSHQELTIQIDAQTESWWFKLVAPAGRELGLGTFDTDDGDGAALTFRWKGGQCNVPDRGVFQIFGLDWDSTDTLTMAEVNFEHHCGESPALSAKFRLGSSMN